MDLEAIQHAVSKLSLPERRALASWLAESPSVAPHTRPAPKRVIEKPRTPPTLGRAVLWTVLSLLAFFLVDAAVFRSGWYLRFLEPNSTAGQAELHIHWITQSRPTARPEVLVMGDSRIAEGFSTRVADASVQSRIHFWNDGVGGTSPRVWFYMLRDIDPTRRRFAAIVLPFDHYSDEDAQDDLNKRTLDLNYVIGRLRITDCLSFARSANKTKLQLQFFTGCLLKGATLRPDLTDLLAHFKTRIAAAKEWRQNGAGYIDGYGGKVEDVTGITADWPGHKVNFPPGLNDVQRATIQSTVMPQSAPQTGALTRYRKLWLGRILSLYKDSQTRIVFLEVPRAPLPRPDSPVPARFIDSVRSTARLTIFPANTFRDLEKPGLFGDGLHLNHAGRPLFSERLAARISDVLGGH